MGHLSSLVPGDLSGIASSPYGYPVTDLSPQVDGGQSAVNASANRNVSDEHKSVMYLSAGITLAAIAILWAMGALVFRGIKL